MRISKPVALVLSYCLSFAPISKSAEPPSAELKTVAVAAFKNGLGFVLRQGEAALENGVGRITPIPDATLGTLWIAPSDAGATLDEVVAYRYKVAGKRGLANLSALLTANAGKTVTVVYEQKQITGEVVGFKQTELPPADPTPVPFGENPNIYRGPVVPHAPVVPDFLLLKVDNKLQALHFGMITQAFLPENAILDERIEEERKALRFKLKGASPKANLTMGYLEHGIGWTPSYLVSLTDEKTAQITMQAVLTNDAEDVKDADVFFIVGVPNFAYANTPSPMALQQSLLDFMKDAGSRDESRNARFYSNAIAGQLVAADGRSAGSFAEMGASVEDLSGAPEEDLFLYTRSDVTLARGERATYNVFSGSVAYEHVYEWEVVDQPRVDGFGNVVQNNYNPNPADSSTTVNNIWHSIRLKNTTKFSWTSAPSMVISGNKPLSQDTLPYTPKAASSNLKMTIATDIRASHEEKEVARQRSVDHRRNYEYDLVTVEGTLRVKNYKTKDVTLVISKTMRGDVEVMSDLGKATKLGEAIQTDNPISRLRWEVPLKAGQEKTVTYRYKLWVRG